MKIGDRITVLTRDNNKGTIRKIVKIANMEYCEIRMDNDFQITELKSNLRPELIDAGPIELFKQANFQPKNIFAIVSTINKRENNNNNSIASLKSSKTVFKPYQFKPLIKFLNSDNRRILIADEVGLGKTIEAAYILTEMMLRGLVKNCLIVCKSTLKEKWKKELYEKFCLDFKIFESRKKLQEAIKEDAQLGQKSILGLISYGYNKKGSDELQTIIKDLKYDFDLLIVDEAHILRNENIKHNALKNLIQTGNSFTVLMTATPVMTTANNLYNLVKIIEPKYENLSLFNDHLAMSRPFIIAIQELSKGVKPKLVFENLKQERIDLKISLKDKEKEYSLKSITVEERFKEDALFNEVEILCNKENFENKDFAKLQLYLSELNSFNQIISRTRKRDVQEQVEKVTRNAELIKIEFSTDEMELYNAIMDEYEGEPLALVTKKRQATSCLPAYIKAHAKKHLINIKMDSKFVQFEKIINQLVKKENKKIIVFSTFLLTLDYLEERLNHLKIEFLRLDGNVKIDKRQTVIDDFEQKVNIKIILLSEAGSEGVDIQFCDTLVNYDLPWNPMVVEQRIGRIDRIGQKSKIINIYNFCIKNTIEEKIVTRLLIRIKVFSESIGMLEDILTTDAKIFADDNNDDLLEHKLYGRKLTEETIQKLMLEAERAIENKNQMKEQIDTDLDNAFVSDLYYKNEIDAISKQKKYITENDIKEMLSLIFTTRLANIKFDFNCLEPYIRWDEGNFSLFDFIKDYLPPRSQDPNLYNAYLTFNKNFRLKNKFICTFKQDVAFENKRIEYLSAIHPLVLASLEYFKKNKFDLNKAFAFQIDSDEIDGFNLEKGIYIMEKHQVVVKKTTVNSPLTNNFGLPLVFRFSELNEFVLLNDNDTKSFLEIDFNFWHQHPNPPSQNECEQILELLSGINISELFNKKEAFEKFEKEEKNIHISRQFRLIDTEVQYNEMLIKQYERRYDRDVDIATEIPKKVKEYIKKIDDLKKQKEKIDFKLEIDLRSISLIEII